MDHDVVAFCLALPDSRKVRRGNRKELLKRVSARPRRRRDHRQAKRGFFRSALGAWLQAQQGGLLEETLLDPRTAQRGLYREDEVEAAAADRRRGRHQGRPAPLLPLPARALEREWVDAAAPRSRPRAVSPSEAARTRRNRPLPPVDRTMPSQAADSLQEKHASAGVAMSRRDPLDGRRLGAAGAALPQLLRHQRPHRRLLRRLRALHRSSASSARASA